MNLFYRNSDFRTTPKGAIKVAQKDPDFALRPDDAILRDNRIDSGTNGLYLVVSKTVDPAHWKDKWDFVGYVRDYVKEGDQHE
jgi:hypothetical protein